MYIHSINVGVEAEPSNLFGLSSSDILNKDCLSFPELVSEKPELKPFCLSNKCMGRRSLKTDLYYIPMSKDYGKIPVLRVGEKPFDCPKCKHALVWTRRYIALKWFDCKEQIERVYYTLEARGYKK